MFFKTIDDKLLSLIDKISTLNLIEQNFYLAGGTALALQLGHRRSFDLDFFSTNPFNSETYTKLLISIGCEIIDAEQNIIHAVYVDAKISLIYYPYPLLDQTISFRNIRLASLKDIACMKTVALSQRAEKKDFYDMFEILKFLPPSEIKQLFIEKYSSSRINCYHILKSFFFFDDAEEQPDPISLNGTTWNNIKLYFTEREKIFMKDMLC